jgi:quinol monooxygenase YgiN
MIHILAMITTKPGLRTEVLESFKANVPAVLEEDGCIEYGAAIDVPSAGSFQTDLGEDSFVVIEKWASIDALMAHAGSAHMKAYAAKTKDKLASRAIHILSPA